MHPTTGGVALHAAGPTPTGASATALQTIAHQLTAVGNFKHGIELSRSVGDMPITIRNTLIGGNFRTGISPPTSTTVDSLNATSTNYPSTVPLLGNDRAGHVCQRCACTTVTAPTTSGSADPNSPANATTGRSPPLPTQFWQVDCARMASDAANRFDEQVPTGFRDGGAPYHANTSGPLSTLRMRGAGVTALPWTTELSPAFTTHLDVLDVSDNPLLNPLPTVSLPITAGADAGGGGGGGARPHSNATYRFTKQAFPKLSALFLQGCDLAAFQNDTLVDLAPTLTSIDLSRPSKPPAADVVFNFTGFAKLAVLIWFDNSQCPRGFYAAARSTSREDVGICARCPLQTFQPEVGKIGIDACLACPEGTVDGDEDPTTPCAAPPFRLADVAPPLTAAQGYLASFVAGTTYDFAKPVLAKVDLFAGYAGRVEKIVYAMRIQAAGTASTNTTSTAAGQPVPSDADNPATTTASAGRFFVDDTGEVLAKMTTVGSYTGTLFARDSVGAEIPVHSWAFEVVAEADDSSATGKGGSIAAGVLAAILVVGLAGVGVIKRRAHQHMMRAHDFEAELLALRESKDQTDLAEALTLTDGLAQVPREIKRKCVTRTEKIGEGQFGEVFKGVLDESSQGGVPGYLVACKSVLDAGGDGAQELLQEAIVMAQVGVHSHLVSLLGVVTSGLPLLLVVSYCEHGSLLTVVRERAEVGDPLSTAAKLRFAVHIAKGMAHLASLHFIHRDLAARNVLVVRVFFSLFLHPFFFFFVFPGLCLQWEKKRDLTIPNLI